MKHVRRQSSSSSGCAAAAAASLSAAACAHRTARMRRVLKVLLIVAAVALALAALVASRLGFPPTSSDGNSDLQPAAAAAAAASARLGRAADPAGAARGAAVELLDGGGDPLVNDGGGGADLQYHLSDMRRLQASVMAELRRLEQQRGELKSAIEHYQEQLRAKQRESEAFNADTLSARLALDELRSQLRDQEEVRGRTRLLHVPAPLYAPADPVADVTAGSDDVGRAQQQYRRAGRDETSAPCRLHACFDYSRCSVTTGFPVYLYEAPVASVEVPEADAVALAAPWLDALRTVQYATRDPKTACLFVAVVLTSSHDTVNADDVGNSTTAASHLQSRLRSLAYWRGDGRNHLLLLVGSQPPTAHRRHDGGALRQQQPPSWSAAATAAMVDASLALRAQPFFYASNFRPDFDIVAYASPPVDRSALAMELLPPAVPAHRQYLLTFDGEPPDVYLKQLGADSAAGRLPATSELRFAEDLWRLAKEVSDFSINLGCFGASSDAGEATVAAVERGKREAESSDLAPMHDASEWRLCSSRPWRLRRLEQSTFALIVPPANASLLATPSLLARLVEALEAGAVPVVLGAGADGRVLLPFDGAGSPLAWREAALLVPRARLVELPLLLASIGDGDILAMRLSGRQLLERHLGSASAVVATLLALVRVRLGLPARPAGDEPSVGALGGGAAVPLPQLTYTPRVEPPDELLGLAEAPLASPAFERNFSTIGTGVHFFSLYASTPWDPVLPSEAKFRGSSYGFRPINGGQGGAGVEFSTALGGNSPKEQFTIVVLTFDRTELMMSQLESYKGLPYLNKVVVVWNNPVLPAAGLKWPDIGVPIYVLKMAKNSLNNRFLPFDVIETEAVLSVDDDVFLRQDEITFAFRVWRENRERLVGFPGRYHAWDLKHGNWLYNSNHSCELSLVLTGAAFFHKYYMHMYSNVMQPAIRAKVDEYMNCEDLAMNFLISHISKKAPIKVTSRWTFLCPSCGDSALWTDKSHFQERHECINFFSRVYGYTPLLYTQYRADSVLFKTKLPSDKTKCFKYV